MQANVLFRPCALGALVVGLGLLAACSTYRPLDQGSPVPWAKAATVRTAPADVVPEAGPRRIGETRTMAAGSHRVRPGDRLSTVARTYGVSVRALAEANELRPPYVIYIGQVLRIPDRPGEGSAPAEPAIAVLGDRYVVRRGDTLSSIAKQLGRPVVELAAANDLAPPYKVFAGQTLRIPPPGAAAVAPARVAAKKPESPKAIVKANVDRDPPPLSGEGFLWPVNGKVIGGFGPVGQGQRRDGIDIAAREGAPVLAAENGVVVYAGDGIRGYGRLILLRHAEGYITTYAHNAALLVNVGDVVERGQVIARVGSTGDVARSQLHFELRKGRKPIDPEAMLVRGSTAVASKE